MKRFRFVSAIFLMPVLGIFTLGCGSSEDSTRDMPPPAKVAKKTGGSSSKTAETKESTGGGGGGGATASSGAVELESTGSATLKGTVSFDGTPPAQTAVKMEKDPDYCRRTDPKKLQ